MLKDLPPIDMWRSETRPCPECDATGKRAEPYPFPGAECPDCDGTGSQVVGVIPRPDEVKRITRERAMVASDAMRADSV